MELCYLDAVKPVRLSLHLIVKRHLPPEAKDWSHEEMYVKLSLDLSLFFNCMKKGYIYNLLVCGSVRYRALA